MFVMVNYRSTFYIGIFVFLIPFLGFPTMWKMGLVVFAGLILIFSSIRFPVSKKVFKNNTNQVKKEKAESAAVSQPIVLDSTPLKNETIETEVKENVSTPPIIKITPISKNSTISKKPATRVSKKVDSIRKTKLKEI